ncbi:MAG: homocysteine S-methyltransferase family protein, partial [Pseudomonadales bacterium]|nr:homocysteine S-methyltransferase family protein [Pseudomonadales bacterium]
YWNKNTVISGCLGPRGDGYTVQTKMSAEESKSYHNNQIQTFALADADVVTALTMNYIDEALGIVKSAKRYAIPVVISFTVETDGKLPSGDTLEEAIATIDAETNNYTSYYMINCAHPEHFKDVLKENSGWKKRIQGIRANASTLSHAELDESEILHPGDKCELASRYKEIQESLPGIRVVGGCCGTDHHHIEEICKSVFGIEMRA